jgi:hypothetical protein
MEDKHTVLVGKYGGNTSLGRPRDRYEVYLKSYKTGAIKCIINN